MNILTRAALALFVLTLAACAQSTGPQVQQAHDQVTQEASNGPPPPPPPPIEQRVPPPSLSAPPGPAADQSVVTGSRIGRDHRGALAAPLIAGAGGYANQPYAQTAPQPMPGSVDREIYEHQAVNPIHQVAADPVSTFSIDVDSASYSNVRRFLSDGRLPPRDSVRIEELVNYFDYNYPLPQNRTQPFSTTVAMAPSPWSHGHTLLHIGLQGYNIIPGERPPLNLVLLLDVSGSMSPEDRLPLAIKGFRMMVDQLTAHDRVSIVVYAGAAGMVLEPTSGADHARIDAALDNLHAGGSTAGGEGLRLAYSLAERNFNRNAINRVMIATDGDFNVGITEPQQLQDFISHERETGIYLSVLAFGRDNYNDALMQRLAQNGNGIASYIDTLAEARRVLHDEMASTLFPIANDVKIQVEFNPGRVAEYRLIGYETRMLRREDFNNDRVDAGDIGAGRAVTAIYELTPAGGATSVDPLRYQQEHPAAAHGREIGFLRIRYKLPGKNKSLLIERPITDGDMVSDIARAPSQRGGRRPWPLTARCCAAIPISTAAITGTTSSISPKTPAGATNTAGAPNSSNSPAPPKAQRRCRQRTMRRSLNDVVTRTRSEPNETLSSSP